MLRVYHLFLATILLLLLPLGAKFVLPYFSTNKVEQKNPVTSTTSKMTPQVTAGATANSVTGNVWTRILGKNLIVPNTWQVAACQGEAPLLCVYSNGKVLGTVEIDVYQISDNPNFQKHLTEAGVPFGAKLDYQNAANQTKVLTALKAWAGDYYTSISQDRQKEYGNKIVFSTHPLEEVSLGKLPGIRYGFTGIKQEGGLQEQYINHAAFDGTLLFVITTAFDPSAVTGKFEKLENLVIFQPYLYAIAENLNL